MNILLKQPLPQFGLMMPADLIRSVKEGINFKIAPDELVEEALNSTSDSYEKTVWLPMVKETTYRMIIHGLMLQLAEAKMPWYKKLFRKLKNKERNL
jgi:hypothetical protein